MPGGLLNLISYGNQNIHLNGNPTKTFFKCTYAKYSNFGLQKFRIDYDGQRDLRLTEPSTFSFKIPRYADLLMDTYLSINIPNIWSPIHYITSGDENTWAPYEFRWIKNLGCMMIQEVQFTIGGQIIQKFSGDYLHNMMERDFSLTKKELFDRMTANVPEIYNPAQALSRFGNYPNAYPGINTGGTDPIPEPSIRSRKLTIPLNLWFMMASKMALPLVSLQYSEVKINITIRPIQDLFTILDVGDLDGGGNERIRPNFSDPLHSFYRFVHPPPIPSDNASIGIYTDTRGIWSSDIHLISTYAFLSDTEVSMFAKDEHKYLIKEVHENLFPHIVGNGRRFDVKSMGLVSDWMWYLRRTDVILRNEWSNYTNWPYSDIVPDGLVLATSANTSSTLGYYPTTDINGFTIYVSGDYSIQNEKKIMTKFAIIIDGKYRENDMESDVFEWIEKYSHTNGNGPDCLYSYNFCLNTDPYSCQPSGAINTSKFGKIEFEISTIAPPINQDAQTFGICDEGQLVGINKDIWNIYKHTYDLNVIEHRYNILKISCGMAQLMYAR
jgi:hypothetical protein